VSWRPPPELPTYPKATRRELWKRLSRLVSGEEEQTLLSFEELRERLHLFQQSYGGIKPIPVRNIVGSAARTSDFDDDFLPLKPHIKRRWENLEYLYPDSDFPPISVYKVGDAYFVIDGHHRVAIAKQRATEMIDAEITEIHTDLPIDEDTDIREVIHLEMEQMFLRHSGLALVRPDARFACRRPVGYVELLENVRLHGYHVMQSSGEVLSKERIAADWYDNRYVPTVEIIRESGLADEISSATETDLFLWIHQRRRRSFSLGGPASYEDVTRGAVEETRAKKKEAKKPAKRLEQTVDQLMARRSRRRDDDDPEA
jgi:hypothetical protein